jgi:hypothetical protein
VQQKAAENEVSPSTAWRILRTDIRMHPYKIHVFQSLTTVWREKRTRLRRNSVITCSRTLWGYLKDKVFRRASRTLPELKERIEESCAQVTTGMLSRVVHNFVLRVQAVRESQGAHIKNVIHNATHMLNSNPCSLF